MEEKHSDFHVGDVKYHQVGLRLRHAAVRGRQAWGYVCVTPPGEAARRGVTFASRRRSRPPGVGLRLRHTARRGCQAWGY
eukprot:8833822-Pyramimonas_sp.AAC.1